MKEKLFWFRHVSNVEIVFEKMLTISAFNAIATQKPLFGKIVFSGMASGGLLKEKLSEFQFLCKDSLVNLKLLLYIL